MPTHLTPLRYPGGKQRLAPFVREVLATNNLIGGHYVEPYAGGAGVALELLVRRDVSHIHLNDSSYPLWSFWNSVLNHAPEFCKLIATTSLTVEEWHKQRAILCNPQKHGELEVGFSAFYLNRCNRSGILSGGIIGGKDQSGPWKMDARFMRTELIRRVEIVAQYRERIQIYNMDAEDFIRQNIPQLPQQTLVYCDPPYFNKASGLYLNSYAKDDHQRLAETIQKCLPRPWIVSYDGAEQILRYYAQRRQFLYSLKYNASRVYHGQEVFIFADDVKIPLSSSLPYIQEALQRAPTPSWYQSQLPPI